MITVIPPVFIAVLSVLAVWKLPKKFGYSFAVICMAYIAAVSYLVPEGVHITTALFGVFQIALFASDSASSLMGIIFGVFGIAAIIYAYSSELDRKATGFALSYITSTIGAVFAGDWLTLIFFWELMAVTSTLLVWVYGGKAVRSGFRYALYHGIGGSLLLMAVVGQYVITGSFMFDQGIVSGWPALLAALGIGVNVGFVGLHSWLPDTYASPHFAASVFLCVFTTKTGVYGMYRAFPEGHIWIAYMGASMAVFGAFTALLQHDMRRLLAYHIQSQVGYMVAGIGAAGALATAGAFGHLFNHILYKGLLFMSVGVIIYRTKTHDVYKLGGLWNKMPITFIAFLIGALSITAVPGFNGFISKGMILNGVHHLQGLNGELLYWMLKIGAIGTFLSFIKLGYYAFFHKKTDWDVRDAKKGQTIGMGILAGLCILFGIWWPGLVQILPVHSPELHLHPYSISHMKDTVLLGIISLIIFKIIRKPLSKLDLPDIDRVIYPGTFYLTKATVIATTSIYRSVNYLIAKITETFYYISNHPIQSIEHVAGRLPFISVKDKNLSRISLRANISTSVMILVMMMTIILILLISYGL